MGRAWFERRQGKIHLLALPFQERAFNAQLYRRGRGRRVKIATRRNRGSALVYPRRSYETHTKKHDGGIFSWQRH